MTSTIPDPRTCAGRPDRKFTITVDAGNVAAESDEASTPSQGIAQLIIRHRRGGALVRAQRRGRAGRGGHRRPAVCLEQPLILRRWGLRRAQPASKQAYTPLSRTGDAGPALGVDMIGGGALVLRTLIEACGAAAVVASEHDILNGIALSLLR
jgi:hypothetical protein